MGLFQLVTSLGILSIRIGSLNTVPYRIFLMVPLGDRHIYFNPNSSTLPSSAVMVAHFTPTLVSIIEWAASTVTLSSVLSLF